MTKGFNFGSVHLDVSGGREAAREGRSKGPFHVAVLGDFSGRKHKPAPQPVELDRDNFDDVFAALKVRVELPVAGVVELASATDFHPDSLVEKLEMFRPLLAARGSGASSVTPTRTAQAGGSLLDAVVEETSVRQPARARPLSDPVRGNLQPWLDAQVAPLLQPKADPKDLERQALVDQVMSAQMRAVLHWPEFQAREAAWRGIEFLVRRVDTSTELKIFLVDISKEEFAASLREASDPRQSSIYRALGLNPQGEDEWAVMVANYQFGPGAEDMDLLVRAGLLAASIGAPFIAGGEAALLGTESLWESAEPREWEASPASWTDFRTTPVAPWVGLTIPGFLARLPYGKNGAECERFHFEEIEGVPTRGDLVWANAANVVACLLAQSFSEDGWEMRLGKYLNVDRLPLYVYQADGSDEALPCSEVLLTERAAQEISSRGVMPLASLKGSDEVRLVYLRSTSKEAPTLQGRW